MKKIIRWLKRLFFGRHPQPEVTAKEVIDKINKSLIEAKSALNGLILESASVTLQTTATLSGQAKASCLVYVAGDWEDENVQSVTYNYKIPEPIKDLKKSVSDLTPMAKLIERAASEFKNTSPVKDLIKGDFELELSFSVSWSATIGADLLFFDKKLGVNGEESYGNERFHKINLKFKVEEKNPQPA